MPEKVLVLEVAGEISSFTNAISAVPGFEFLAQELQDSHYESELFYRAEKGKHKPVEKFAYLTMSSQAGLQKLLSIWKKFEETGTLPNGQKSFARAFEHLIDMRVWDTRDRLDIRDGGGSSMLTDWQERLHYLEETGSTDLVPFEIELWFRGSEEARRKAELHLSSVILQCGGSVSSTFLFKEIGYHALIGYLPATEVQSILDSQGQNIELMQCDEVMFFRPVGQCVVSPSEGDGLEEAREYKSHDQIYGDTESLPPVIALLDGLPMENHSALAGRLNIDDPDGFELLYNGDASAQLHGTSMASLIIHGDLNDEDTLPQPRRLYTRPIMAPSAPSLNGNRFESIPDEYLPLDLVHRAVKRMKEGDAGEEPTAPEVKVINLSIGERYRLFDRRMSPWARMLDWLSYKYDVLFVVSAGNMLHDVELPVTETEFLQCSESEKKKLFFKSLASQQPERRMCSPAESVNAITIRSSHNDLSEAPLPPGVLDLMPFKGMPSPINPITLGRKNAVKPELMMPGGRQAYRQKSFLSNEPIVFSIANSVTLTPRVRSRTFSDQIL